MPQIALQESYHGLARDRTFGKDSALRKALESDTLLPPVDATEAYGAGSARARRLVRFFVPAFQERPPSHRNTMPEYPRPLRTLLGEPNS